MPGPHRTCIALTLVCRSEGGLCFRTTSRLSIAMLSRIQVLRGVAAYMVVIFHTVEFLASNTDLAIPRAAIGAAGVDIFFVISGFIMIHVTRESETPARFALARIARIVPLYWIATIGAVLAAIVAPWSFVNARIDPEALLMSIAFIPTTDARGAFEPILFVGWTLNFEMAFYAIFACSLFFSRKYQLLALAAGLLLLFTIGRLAGQNHALGFYGNAILFEFAAGCIIGAFVRNARLKPFLDQLPAIPVVTFGTLLLLLTALLPESFFVRPISWGVPAMLIVLGVVLLDLRKSSLPPMTMTNLGDASYSAYLLHPFLVVAVGVITLKLFGQTWIAAVVIMVAVVTSTAVISSLSFRLIEKPSARILRRLFQARSPHAKVV